MRLFGFQHARGTAATFFPVHVIVKPILKHRVDRKACMPDYQNMETIAAIPRVCNSGLVSWQQSRRKMIAGVQCSHLGNKLGD